MAVGVYDMYVSDHERVLIHVVLLHCSLGYQTLHEVPQTIFIAGLVHDTFTVFTLRLPRVQN